MLKKLSHGITFKLKENDSLSRQKNTREIIVNHKGARMVKDGEV